MILDTVTKTLELVLGTAQTTTAMPVTVDYVDMTTTTTVPGSLDFASNGTTLVTIGPAPAASTQRKFNLITVYNADSVSKEVTIRLNNNTVLRPIVVVTLSIGDTLSYTDTVGWKVTDSTGAIHTVVASPQFVVAAGKTFTVNNSITFAGTDGTTMTFPTTSDTLARQNGDLAQTFSSAAAAAAANVVRADQLGSYLESIVLVGSPITLTTTATAYNITSITLTAGTWIVNGSTSIISGTSDTIHISSLSTTSATNGNSYEQDYLNISFGSGVSHRVSGLSMRVVVATTQIVYLVTYAAFSGTSPTAFGKIFAHRITAY